MRLNVGCGKRVMDGWTNVDIQVSKRAKRPPEILSDLRSIPLEDNVADIIMAIHVFEHFYYWEASEVITEWFRLLKPGGKLILELPDIVKCCQNIAGGVGLEGSGKDHAMGMWGLYGDPQGKDPYMHHKWGWCPSTLTKLLLAHGFSRVDEATTEWHAIGRDHRDMRLEAMKPRA